PPEFDQPPINPEQTTINLAEYETLQYIQQILSQPTQPPNTDQAQHPPTHEHHQLDQPTIGLDAILQTLQHQQRDQPPEPATYPAAPAVLAPTDQPAADPTDWTQPPQPHQPINPHTATAATDP